MYHSISNVVDQYTISLSSFYRQIEFIRSNYSVIRLREIENAMTNDSNSRQVIITFDDAYRDFVECACPVLEKFSVPSTVFVPTGFMGGYDEWNCSHTESYRRWVMDGPQLQELRKTGLVDFGSHTIDHNRMTGLQPDEMIRQAVVSKRTLEDLLGTAIMMFSYPYGQLDDFSALTARVLSQTGYKIAVTTHWGTRNSLRDLLGLRRIFLRETDGDATVRAKIDGLYDWVALKEQVGFRVRSLRRALLGDL